MESRNAEEQKKKVRVVLHDAAKGKALSGAEGVYVLLPPNFGSSHVRVDNSRRTQTIAAAVEDAGVPHVVLLSSIGAQQSDGTDRRDVRPCGVFHGELGWVAARSR